MVRARTYIINFPFISAGSCILSHFLTVSMDVVRAAVAEAIAGVGSRAIMDAPTQPLEQPAPGRAPRSNQKSKRWVFTINNPTEEDADRLQNVPQADYVVWQLEQGEEGTRHFQGYVRFMLRQRLSHLRQVISPRGHFEVARGTEMECDQYCRKPETRVDGPWCTGIMQANVGEQGHRTDLDAIARDCTAGMSIERVALTYPSDFIRYHAGIQALHSLVAPQPPAVREVKTLVLWGPTGVGKSYRVATQYPDAYKVKPSRGPWDNYKGEDIIWFEEFDYEKWPIFEMNEYLDRYRCVLPCRYKDKYAAWTKVIICANTNPDSWYPTATSQVRDAFRRRLGRGCRYVMDRHQDVSESEPSPNYWYLLNDADTPPPRSPPPSRASSPSRPPSPLQGASPTQPVPSSDPPIWITIDDD